MPEVLGRACWPFPDMLFYDIKAAFPSIEWGYLLLLRKDMNIGLRDSQLRMLRNLHKVSYLGKDLCIDFLKKKICFFC